MSDIDPTNPNQTQPDPPRLPDDDETRPNRRVGHPHRTRLSQPEPPPSSKTTPPPEKIEPPANPASPPAELPDDRLTRPTKPVPVQPRPAFTRQQSAGQRPTQLQPPPPPQPPPTHRRTYYQSPVQPTPPRLPQPTVVTRRPQGPPRNWWRWATRSLASLAVISLIGGVLLLAFGAITYFWIASQLPPAEELQARAFQSFATSQILDREGNLLWEILDPTGGRRTRVSLDQISPELIEATVATEDRFFYNNVGVDPIAISRAVYYNLSEGEIVSGASTITQQLARNLLLSPEERTEQSLTRKVREAVLAVEINRRYSKDQILDIYLNQIYYGNLAYGIEAASETYFGKPALELSLAEASMLAGLPQSPAIHDPYTNREGANARQATVLGLMVEADYITSAEAEAAKIEELNFQALNFTFEAPHFVVYVRQELERIVPPDFIYQAGLKVQTTLDPRLQAIAEEEVRNQVEALAGRNVSNGSLVALDTSSGQILAMVGSKDFQDESISGQVNLATSPRQPGSSIKPLTYLAAFETLDWTPSTLIMDTPVEYPDGAGGAYRPRNYDDKFHGPVLLRSAFANSYNIPPIKALALMGVDALKEMAARLGITTLTRDDYGLALTLGSGEVSVLEMAGAYQAIANQGLLVPPTAILQITDNFGQAVEYTPPKPPVQVLRPEHAYLISNILADNEARTPAFGPNNPLRLSRPAAAKTGTTNDYRDSWTLGYTPDIVTGVWLGNADNTPMDSVAGSGGAAPIWHNFMERAHEGRPVRDFIRPDTIVALEICADSGTLPSPACPQRRTEIFFRDQPPLGPENDIHQLIKIDRNTGLRANEFCSGNVEERYYRVYPLDGVEWALSQGFEQPPTDFCPSANIVAKITAPLDGSTARGNITLEGVVAADNFSHYQIEMGLGTNPEAFTVVAGPINQIVQQGILGVFDTTQVENGAYTLRLVVSDRTGGQGEARVRLLVDNVPTPVPSDTPTPTLTPTVTETPTLSPTITLEPATATSTPTGLPATGTPTGTAAPTGTATLSSPTATTQPPTQTPTPPAPTSPPPTVEPSVEPPTPTSPAEVVPPTATTVS